MNTTAIPPRMDRSEAERICRLAPGSSACDRAKEQAAAWEGYLAQRNVENDRLRAAREARQAADAKARADAREQERLAVAEALKAEIRRTFFSANPSASDEDFARLAQRLYDDALVERTRQGADADRAELMTRHTYGM